MKKYIYIFTIISVILYGCFNNPNKNTVKSNEDLSKLAAQRYKIFAENDSAVLIGKNIRDVNKIIRIDTLKGRNNPNKVLIFYFSNYDCSVCIKRGLELIEILDQKNYDISIFVIFSDGSIGNIRSRYDYKGYLYEDVDFLMNDLLNYTISPIFLSIDSSFYIIETYHPRIDYDTNDSIFYKFIDGLF